MDLNRIQKLLRIIKKAGKLSIDKVRDKECLRYLLANGYASKRTESSEIITGEAPSYAKKFKFLHKRYNLNVEVTKDVSIKLTRKGELKSRFKRGKEEVEEDKPTITKEEDERED